MNNAKQSNWGLTFKVKQYGAMSLFIIFPNELHCVKNRIPESKIEIFINLLKNVKLYEIDQSYPLKSILPDLYKYNLTV